ncbi:MAG: type IV pilin protein [Methylococcales bacterium]|nr:type IV pilin protein [Methylococcales bacterium]MDD5754460.1 type IV pilin protein [Methylococcales bacterium]
MKSKQIGFTLIELMITVAIIGILTSVGYPSYQHHIQKAKRSEAQAALVSMATAMEQWRVENNNDYTGAKDAAGKILVFSDKVPTNGSGTQTYTLSIPTLAAGNYTLKAVPYGTQADDECGYLTLDSTGVKASESGTACWE